MTKVVPLVAGVDEVGRGCLFGPVVAAAVLLPPAAVPVLTKLGLTDSKKLKPRQREALVNEIHRWAIAHALGMASVAEIDRINILQASLLAMRRAVLKLGSAGAVPDLCLVDGNQPIPGLSLEQRTVVNGDGLEPAIAAASILAKVWRDHLLQRLDARYPGYGLAQNKGYGTPTHKAALSQWGPSKLHRLSFAPCQSAKPLTLLGIDA